MSENLFEMLAAEFQLVCVVLCLTVRLFVPVVGLPGEGLAPGVGEGVLLRTRRAVPSQFNAQEKQAIVDKHNTVRRAEGAANMEKMKWNDYLAEMAQDWADTCGWYHGQPSRDPASMPYNPVGQNLYFTSGTLETDSVVQAWYDEKKDYFYDSGVCLAVCGHYTQVVWAKSKEVGCGFKKCPELRDENNELSGTNANYVVCNYGPAGNFAGEKPFLKGSPCSLCSSGTGWCSDGLCNGDCSSIGPDCACSLTCQNGGQIQSDCSCKCKDGWYGPDCSVPCKDTDSRCGASPGWPSFVCNMEGFEFVPPICPALCRLCLAAPPTLSSILPVPYTSAALFPSTTTVRETTQLTTTGFPTTVKAVDALTSTDDQTGRTDQILTTKPGITTTAENLETTATKPLLTTKSTQTVTTTEKPSTMSQNTKTTARVTEFIQTVPSLAGTRLTSSDSTTTSAQTADGLITQSATVDRARDHSLQFTVQTTTEVITSQGAETTQPKTSTVPQTTMKLQTYTAPDSSATPQASTTPRKSAEPQSTMAPHSSDGPQRNTAQQSSAGPQATTLSQSSAGPQATMTPQLSTNLQATTVPKLSAGPQVTTVRQSSAEPQATIEPQPSDGPQATTLLETSAGTVATTATQPSVEPQATTAPQSSAGLQANRATQSSTGPPANTAQQTSDGPQANTVPESSAGPKTTTPPQSSTGPQATTVLPGSSAEPNTTAAPQTSTASTSSALQTTTAPEITAVPETTAATETDNSLSITSESLSTAIQRTTTKSLKDPTTDGTNVLQTTVDSITSFLSPKSTTTSKTDTALPITAESQTTAEQPTTAKSIKDLTTARTNIAQTTTDSITSDVTSLSPKLNTPDTKTGPSSLPADSTSELNEVTTQNPCSSFRCQNGGLRVKQNDVCSCSCLTEWEGEKCQFNKKEKAQGVIVRIISSSDVWDYIQPNLLPMVTDAVNDHCNENVRECCPWVTSAVSGLDLAYVEPGAVQVARGYPTRARIPTGTLTTVLFVVQASADNALCEAASRGRKKRQSDALEIYLDQKVLYDIVNSIEENITNYISQCCNASVVAIIVPDVPSTGTTQTTSSSPTITKPPPAGNYGFPVWAYGLIGLALVTLIGVFAFLCFITKWRRLQKTQHDGIMNASMDLSESKSKSRPSSKPSKKNRRIHKDILKRKIIHWTENPEFGLQFVNYPGVYGGHRAAQNDGFIHHWN